MLRLGSACLQSVQADRKANKFLTLILVRGRPIRGVLTWRRALIFIGQFHCTSPWRLERASYGRLRVQIEMPHSMKLRPKTPARKSGSVAAQCVGKCQQRAAVGASRWTKRLLFAVGIALVFLLVRATYNYVKPASDTFTGKLCIILHH